MVRVRLPQAPDPTALIEPEGAVETDLEGIDQGLLRDLYQVHGAILLRGFDLSLASFGQFCRRLCPTAVINESPGRMRLEGDSAVQTVNLGLDAFPLHPELAREAWKPDSALFACFSPPTRDGQTTLCDGIELVRRLDPAICAAMEPRRLMHVFQTWPELLNFWLGTATPDDALLANPPQSCPYRFHRRADGMIMRSFTRPLLHRPMFADIPAFGSFLLFARDYLQRRDFPLLDNMREVPDTWVAAIRTAASEVEVALEWRQGDVLILDNTRFMHGRRAIRDVAERRIATYFGYLADAPRNPEEPLQPPWRERDFVPPINPLLAVRG